MPVVPPSGKKSESAKQLAAAEEQAKQRFERGMQELREGAYRFSSRARGQSDLIAILREEILAVIAKQVMVELENVQVRMNRDATVSTLEINVEIPNVNGAGAGLRPDPRPRDRHLPDRRRARHTGEVHR